MIENIREQYEPRKGDENYEIELLRRQVADLKDELNNSRITSQVIIRKAMRSRSSWLDSFVKFEVVSIPFLGLIMGAFSYFLGATLWPIFIFLILCGISTWLDWHTMRIASNRILTMPMAQLKESLIRQKKQRMIQTIIETPIAIGWLFWYIYTLKEPFFSKGESYQEIFFGTIAGGVIGTIVAIIVIIIVYKKAQKTNNELIDTIGSEK